MKDYYSILEIEENADEALIKSQYKKLAALYHPDKNPNNSDKFINLNDAHKTLMDRALRDSYDKDFREYKNQKENGTDNDIIPYRIRFRDGGNVNIEIDFSDDFDDFMGTDIINQDQFIVKTVKLQRYVKCPGCEGEGKGKGTLALSCPNCKGSGLVKNKNKNVSELCSNCNGYGDLFIYKCNVCNGMARIKKYEEVTLKFNKDDLKNQQSSLLNGNSDNKPANIIIFKDMGDYGVFGGKNGNLTVSVKIDPGIIDKINNENKGFSLKKLFLKIKTNLK